MSKPYKLNWNGEEVFKIVSKNGEAIMSEIGLVAEGESKKELRKGHGVVTSTLRRSIHSATPGYNWSADAAGSELGGKGASPARKNGKLVVELGSGLVYALAIHQGWAPGDGLRGSFAGYHYLTNGVNKTRAQVPGIVMRHKV